MLIGVVASSNPGIVTNGLTLHLDAAQTRSYPGSGTSWSDLTGINSAGTLTNGPTFSSSNGGSILFDGVNDRVDLPAGFSNFTSGLTFEAWVRPQTGLPQYGRIIELGNGVRTNNIFFYAPGNGYICLEMQYPDGVNQTIGGCSAINALTFDVWQHWVGMLTGTQVILYKNGVQSGNPTGQTNLPTNTSRTVNSIGTTSGNYREFWKGNIAQLRIYNRALSATEVGQNYNATRSRFGL